MEHKLLLGGYQHLPFARSRIKALRATGLETASQRFEIDGSLIEVRVVGEHEYIRITGGGCKFVMDSGVVDLIGVTGVGRFDAGLLHETEYATAYHAPYSDPGGKWAGWRTYSADTIAGQLTGVLTVSGSNFRGHVRPSGEAALSFTPRNIDVAVPMIPPLPVEWAPDPEDGTLAAKKYTVTSCPASVFTGRTRLYVQAMYGRTLYETGNEADPGASLLHHPAPTLVDNGQPRLSLATRQYPDDEIVYPNITINTSTGLHLDALGRHWLMRVDGAQLTVYPLWSSQCGEAARKYLNADSDVLSDIEKEKLEAFILAYSRPDSKRAFLVNLGDSGSDYSMGYGWHWNWSGTAADIVNNVTFEQDATNSAMRSTHRRISVTPSLTGSWAAAVSVVEGPTDWAVNRLYWCITEPGWTGRNMSKLTPRLSTLMAGSVDAPFYAFYKRDLLQVCRVEVTQRAAEPDRRSKSVDYADAAFGGAISHYTYGLRDGYAEDFDYTNEYHTAVFSVGGTETAELILSRTTTSTRDEVYGKAITTPGTTGFDTGPGQALTEYFYGYPTDGVYQSQWIYGTRFANNPPTVTFQQETSSRSQAESSIATVIVPLDDAEACFLHAETYYTDTRTGRTVETMTSTGYIVETQCRTDGVFGPVIHQYVVAGLGGVSATTTPDPSVTTENDVQADLVSKTGTTAAAFGDLGGFHNAEDEVSASYSVKSGTVAAGGVTLSSTITPVGAAVNPDFPALVGWV